MVDSGASDGEGGAPPAERSAEPQPASPAVPAKKPRRKQRLSTRILKSPGFQRGIACLAANYLRFVNWTSPFPFDPPDAFARYIHLNPVIFTMWHGQHFMLPFARIFDFDARVLISRSNDGEINARVAEKLGVKTIRGSTARDPSRMMEKGALAGFVEMKAALAEGRLRDDDRRHLQPCRPPRRPRHRHLGAGQRPADRPHRLCDQPADRRQELGPLDDQPAVQPRGDRRRRAGHVPEDADSGRLEEKRLVVETSLNEATARAYRIVDRRHG